MKQYDFLTQKDLTKTVTLLKDFSIKFPLMTLEDFDYGFLSKEFKITKKHLISAVVFLDWLKGSGTYIKMQDINSMKVKSAFVSEDEIKNEQKYRFQFIIKNKKTSEPVRFDHLFTFYDNL